MPSSKAFKEYKKKAGDAFTKSKLSKVKVSDVKNVKIRGDYGKRQSKNIIDARDPNGKTYKRENAKGTLDDKVMHGTSVTENRSLRKTGPDTNSKNANIHANGMRTKYPDLVYKRMINPSLDLKPGSFKKPKKGKK